MNSRRSLTMLFILLAFGGGFFCGHIFSLTHDDSFKKELSPKTDFHVSRNISEPKDKSTSDIVDYSISRSIHMCEAISKPNLQSKPDHSLNSVYAYTDEVKIGNLLNRLSENIDDGNELRILATVGTAEIAEEVKSIAFDNNKSPHIRAASISASDWQADNEKLINLLEQETDTFIIEAIITALDETDMSEDKRKLANQAVLNACAVGEDAILKTSRVYFSDKLDELSQLLTSGYNYEKTPDIVKWLIENISWEDNPIALKELFIKMPDETIRKAIIVAANRMEKDENKATFHALFADFSK